MQHSTGHVADEPSVHRVVLLLGGGSLAVALILGALVIVGPEGQDQILDWLLYLFLAVTGVGSTSAAVNARRAVHNTNGSLDARIEGAISRALERAGASDSTHADTDDDEAAT